MLIVIHQLELTFYRNFTHLQLSDINKTVLIYGHNGAGKTNILEAISYLSPGRGIRSTTYQDLCNVNNNITSPYWNLKARCDSWNISMAYSTQTHAREILLNETKVNSLEIGNIHNIIWLTPQMDRLFANPATDRRRFLDRTIYAHDKQHALHLKQYERLLKERLHHLTNAHYDDKLLEILEQQIATLASNILHSRHSMVSRLQTAIAELPSTLPEITLTLDSEIMDKQDHTTFILNKLRNNRKLDSIAGKTHFAPHRVEFNAFMEDDTPAKLCSTGQQKIILITILMAHIELIRNSSPTLPIILLLDEIFVHLDEQFRQIVSNWIYTASSHGIQSWVTATDAETFSFIPSDNTTYIDATKLGRAE